ncbi:MAG: hypothetical protein K0U72_13970 [Gammaproteobacteria bacterium]|nr:hypothetical protein [Gammaproteobacteria bacterium]
MSETLKKTLRKARKSRVDTDDGRNVWKGPVETVELELMSTMRLQKVLQSGDTETRQKIEAVAANNPEDGVLAHDVENDSYELVDAEGNDEFSLVSTQMLQRMLRGDEIADDTIEPLADDAGFDPYNSD